MRLYVLAMIMFLLNLSVVMVDTLGIYNFNIATDSQWRNDISDVKTKSLDPATSADVSTSFGFGDFISGFNIFIGAVYRIVNIGTTLILFGVNSTIANIFGAAGGIVYLLGLAQFVSNRGLRGMQ